MSPKSLRWLHGIGYVTTAIVALELIGIGGLILYAWQQQRAADLARIEYTRTHEGPLRPTDFVRKDAVKLLSALPKDSDLGSDGLRFAAMPSFGKSWFAISIAASAPVPEGRLLIFHRNDQGDVTNVSRQDFSLPLEAYRALVMKLDRQADGWKGETGWWTDGTAVAFERVRADRITSGEGNSPTHYGKIAAIVRDGLVPYSPTVRQLDSDWMPRD